MHVPLAPHFPARGGPPGTVLIAARRRLADRVAAGIDAGLEPAPCRGRVLETALALRLLDSSGLTRSRDELARFLDSRRSAARPGSLDHVLADCVLTGTPLPGDITASVLGDFDHFTAGRKRTLLEAITVVFGAPPPTSTPAPHDGTALHRWASTVATAGHVIITRHATAGQREELLAALAHPGVRDGHLLCHLLSAHALLRLPGTEAVVTSAVERLLATAVVDGGIPFIERLDVFCSALAGLGLATTSGGATRAAEIADRIAALQCPDGGWGYATGVEQSDVDSTAVCVELLAYLDPIRYAPQLASASAYLHDIRGDDGGFPTYLRGARSEVAMTAAAANAIGLDQTGAQVLRDAAGFIVRGQRHDGTFEPGWSRSTANTQCRVVLALNRAGTVADAATRSWLRAAVTRTVDRVVRDQNDDGGWGQRRGEPSDPISTSFALISLARCRDGGAAVPAGLRHLLARQHADGGFASRPDSTGPRGFVYDVPVLANLYALLALGHLTQPTAAGLPA
ncbi:prenyltransferase/squalene oxidase repeat-containing protein [Lentzea sp. NPDC051838]|uniref:prenyltransferase/squalene oxidase repeat-containing protein n=1 Tax=Lentzea sp. NPDC051838 TaxID=3154849 RepID=UPI00341E044C